MSETKRDKALEAIRRYADGEHINQILRSIGLQHGDFYRMKANDPEIAALFDAAREAKSELLMDETIDIADTDENAGRARNRINARQVLASKINPRTFGDQMRLEVTGQIDLTAAIGEAQRRLERPICDLELLPSGEYGTNPDTDDARSPDKQSGDAPSSATEAPVSAVPNIFDD